MATNSVADLDPGSGAFLIPGWVKVRIRIRDERTGSHFLELRNHFRGLKYSNSLMDGNNSDPGSGMEKSGSGINIPDPQKLATNLSTSAVCHRPRFFLGWPLPPGVQTAAVPGVATADRSPPLQQVYSSAHCAGPQPRMQYVRYQYRYSLSLAETLK